MAAPTTTPRQSIDGIKLDDGHSTIVAFERAPGFLIWEKSVTPPGLEGDEAINTTTMHNIIWRTFAARKLFTLTQMTFTGAYDPQIYSAAEIQALCNQEGSITVHFPDLSTLDFFGYLKSFIPGENVEGTQPEATVTIVPTNQDPTTGSEQAPVITEVSGT